MGEGSRSQRTPAALVLAAVLFLAGLGMLAFVYLRPAGPTLSRLEPARARAGDTITVTGSGFAASPQGNIVLFGDRAGRVISASGKELRVELPEVVVADGATATVGVRVLVGKAVSAPMDIAVYHEATAAQSPAPAVAASAPEAEAQPPPQLPQSAPPGTQAAAIVKPAAPAAAKPAKPSKPPVGQPELPAVQAPPTLPEPVVPTANRRFVLERTAVASNKHVNADLAGFDTTGVEVKRAPDVLGRVDFDVSPGQVKAGAKYTVKVFLINDGSKSIKLKEMFVATNVNGRLASGPVSPRVRDIGSKKKEVIGTFSDTWRDSIATWAMDVTVTSERGDVYKNQVIWK
jgi:hypothetical protein